MIDLGNGIYQLDANYIQSGVAAFYILQQDNQCAIIDTGINSSLPQTLSALKTLALSLDDVRYIIPTHLHLDHAGGASQLMKKCLNAQLIIHPLGAKHMADPTRLIEGTKAVYGDEKYQKLYGDIVPVDEKRMIEAPDNFRIALNGRELLFIDTPGHANHHFCIYDKQSNTMFSGDTMGISYPPLNETDVPFIFATTTPVQFNPDKLLKSIDKICTFKPNRLLLTHFGAVPYSDDLIKQLKQSVIMFRDIALAAKNEASDGREKIIAERALDAMVNALNQHGSTLSEDKQRQSLTFDANINAQGLNVWLDRLERFSV